MQDEDAVKVFACNIQQYLAADLLIGVHGAGLSNLRFLRPGGVLIELVGQFDGRMTPLCGFHGPLASVYDVHHYVSPVRRHWLACLLWVVCV